MLLVQGRTYLAVLEANDLQIQAADIDAQGGGKLAVLTILLVLPKSKE